MIKAQVREDKEAIRSFMRNHYTDDRLVELFAHAKAGLLSYTCCCCFIGIVTADHPLATSGLASTAYAYDAAHYIDARRLPGAKEAERAFQRLADHSALIMSSHNDRRRQIIIPMIKAEIARRMALTEAKSELTLRFKPAAMKKAPALA